MQEGDNLICEICSEGRYLLEVPPIGEVLECKFCPNELAQCKGGSTVGPKAGVWRRSNTTGTFMLCPRQDSCLGMDMRINGTVEESPTGWCDVGYYGAFCSACLPGYRGSEGFQCKECSGLTSDLLRVCGSIITALVLLSLLVISTLNSSTTRQTHSVFFKILLNHMQMIIVTMTFDIKWPKFI